MKNLILVMFLLSSTITLAQDKKGTELVKIQTSAECDECKVRLEEVLNYTKGVKYSNLDVASKVLEIKYLPSKISLEKIKQMISELGYDADEVKANPTAYEALPACCKAGGMEHHD